MDFIDERSAMAQPQIIADARVIQGGTSPGGDSWIPRPWIADGLLLGGAAQQESAMIEAERDVADGAGNGMRGEIHREEKCSRFSSPALPARFFYTNSLHSEGGLGALFAFQLMMAF
jgi:hypothetical protein